MKVMQNATCVAFFCRCKMQHMYSEVIIHSKYAMEPADKKGSSLLLTLFQMTSQISF
mgnify:CR=1 FL=1